MLSDEKQRAIAETGYSDRYESMIDAAVEFALSRITEYEPVPVPRGVDAMSGASRGIAKMAAQEVLEAHGYELSYGQLCNAMHRAMQEFDRRGTEAEHALLDTISGEQAVSNAQEEEKE